MNDIWQAIMADAIARRAMEQAIAARKARRLARRPAALKGWATRRAA